MAISCARPSITTCLTLCVVSRKYCAVSARRVAGAGVQPVLTLSRLQGLNLQTACYYMPTVGATKMRQLTQEDLPATREQRNKLYQITHDSYYLEAEFSMAYAGSELRRIYTRINFQRKINRRLSNG